MDVKIFQTTANYVKLLYKYCLIADVFFPESEKIVNFANRVIILIREINV
jgi:hypothetical protein